MKDGWKMVMKWLEKGQKIWQLENGWKMMEYG